MELNMYPSNNQTHLSIPSQNVSIWSIGTLNKQTNKQTNKPSQWFPVYPSRHLHSAEVVVPTRVHIPPYLQGLGSHADISVIEIKGLTIQILKKGSASFKFCERLARNIWISLSKDFLCMK